MQRSKIFFILISIFLTTSSVYAEKAAIDRPTPYYPSDQAFFDKDGNKHYLEEFEDRTILLVFWATWCGACVDEMDSLEILARDFRKLPFDVVAVSQDFQGVEMVKKFYNEHEIRHLEIYHDYRNTLFSDMKVISVPTAYLINPAGQVVVEYKGTIKWHEEAIRRMILEVIPGNPTPPKNTYKKPAVNYNVTKKVESSDKLDHNKAGEDDKNISKKVNNP